MLGAEEYESLVAARRTLWRIRFALHAASRKAEERLLFEHQRELAKRFGLRDEHAANLAVEQFMQGYFRAAMAIERIGERVLQRLDEARAAARGPIVRHALDTDFDEVAGFLDARDPGLFEREPAAVVRAFRMLLEHPRLNGFRSTLLRRLDAVLPGRVHRVIHEDLLADPEGETRRLLAALDLPFEGNCLRFHENNRAVRTASSEQVRRPINRDGVERWRAYEAWLGPLKEALGPALGSYPDAPEG